MTSHLTLAAAAAFVLVAQTPTQTPPTFGTSTHGVPVLVAVFDGDRVVANLTPRDFEIRDNGVSQTATAADLQKLPIDLRLVFDTSGSISEDDLARYLKTMRKVTSALEPRDRCEIVTFNARIADAASRQSPPITIDLKREGADGTAFFDAVSLSLVDIATPERRRITIVLSDALDNASFFDEAALLDVARHTDAVVYTILPGDPTVGRNVSVSRLQAVSLLTGGRLIRTPEQTVGTRVNEAIQEFRQSYLVQYVLAGTPTKGWHKLDVKVRGYKVKSRLGYFAR